MLVTQLNTMEPECSDLAFTFSYYTLNKFNFLA